MRNCIRYISFLVVIFFSNCSLKNEKAMFELMDKTGIDFNNQVEDGKKENSFLDFYF
jgi:hypothetical protein